jgi:hypothetical protein
MIEGAVEPPNTNAGRLIETSNRFTNSLLTIGEKRSRKQLLVANSELNRAQLSEEWQTMTLGVANLAHRAKTVAAWASSAALLAAGVRALRRGPAPLGTAKSSWVQKMLNRARLASTIWFAFRARSEKDEHK